MCFFRKKKVAEKVKEDRELVEGNSKAIEALIILANNNDVVINELQGLQEKLKYLIPSDNSKVVDYDNFEITSQMKDMSAMTSEFLQGMGSLSKDMMKLTKEKDFLKVEKQFTEAMTGVEMQAEQIEQFMDETESAFSSGYLGTESDNKELEGLIGNEAVTDNMTEQMIEKELEELKKKMS